MIETISAQRLNHGDRLVVGMSEVERVYDVLRPHANLLVVWTRTGGRVRRRVMTPSKTVQVVRDDPRPARRLGDGVEAQAYAASHRDTR